MSEPMIGYRCRECRHIRADYSCDAFTRVIPWAIVQGFDHSQPFVGDGGIRFEQRPTGEPAPVFFSLYPKEIEPSGIPDGTLG